jgi:hypothetical protein
MTDRSSAALICPKFNGFRGVTPPKGHRAFSLNGSPHRLFAAIVANFNKVIKQQHLLELLKESRIEFLLIFQLPTVVDSDQCRRSWLVVLLL